MNGALSPELVAEAAVVAGVCARPVISKVTDMDTGELRLVPIACGSTREHRCPACAERARRLRMQQCREGWHLDTEPEWQPAEHDDQADDDEGQGDEHAGRRVRSTRRRQDVPDLPRVPVEDRTIGRVFTAPGRQDLPALDVRDLHAPVLRAGHRRGRPGRPGQLRLPARRAGCVALPEAGGPVLAEPAPLRRLPGPVLRRRRGPTPPRPPPARRHPGHDPPQHPPRGAGGHLPPGLVARPRHRRLRGPAPADLDRCRLRRPRHRRAPADLGPGPRRARRRPRRRAGARRAVRGTGRLPRA